MIPGFGRQPQFRNACLHVLISGLMKGHDTNGKVHLRGIGEAFRPQ